MSRKSSVITLGILAAVAAIGVTSCCCINNWNDEDEQKDGHGAGGVRHGTRHRTHRWIPIFWGGGGGGGGQPAGHGTGTGSGRGGFGSSGHGGGGGVGA